MGSVSNVDSRAAVCGRRSRPGPVAAALVLAVLGWNGRSHAQDGEECMVSVARGPEEITPAFDSVNVPLNASVRVRYSADYFAVTGANPDDSFRLLRCGSVEDLGDCLTEGITVTGRTSLILDSLVFEPTDLLDEGTQYLAVANGIDNDFEAAFRTTELDAGSGGVDLQAPRLGGITGFSASEVTPSCEAPEGGFRVDVTLDPAQGEPAGGDVEYLLYLTRGPGVDAPELRARVRGVPNEIVIAFVLEPEEATGPICVTVQAVDSAGNLGEVPEPLCEDPIQGNFFEPICSASAGPGRSWPSWPVSLLIAVAWLSFRVRRDARAYGK